MTPAPQSAAPVASLERRFYAFALDRAIAWSLVGLSGLAAWWWFFREDAVLPGVLLVVGALLLVGLAFAIPLGLRGTSPGKSAFGIRAVNPETGTPIGVGRALLRTLILGVATLPLFGLGTAVLAWTAVEDRARERRGWHDYKARSIVVDVRPVEVLAGADEHERPRHVVNLTAMRLMPVRQTPPTPAPVLVVPSARTLPTPGDAGEPSWPAAPATAVVVPSDRREPVRPLTPVPPPADLPPPGATPPVGPTGVQPAPAAGPETVGRRRKHAADLGPGAGQPAATPRRTTWRVVFDSGESFVVEGLGLVGRRPEGRAGEPVRHVVPLVSEDMSISKTHAQFHLAGDGALVVMDRGSTNGSILVRRGVSRDLSAGRPATLLDGDRVLFGDREMRVAREQA
jgi:uncharacterized RDD family membrane protein YckC